VHSAPCGSGATCPGCGWVDDFEQLVHPDLAYGPNGGICLRDAQARASRAEGSSRGDGRDPCWRPLSPGETPLADPEGPASPVCYVGTPDPLDYVPYWRRGPRR
jgi:hypothetical protein